MGSRKGKKAGGKKPARTAAKAAVRVKPKLPRGREADEAGPKAPPPAAAAGVPPKDPVLHDDGELEEEGERLAEEFERFFLCPLCGARVSVLLDPSVEAQTLIEDCEVCCQPLEIRYTVEEGKIAEFDVQAA